VSSAWIWRVSSKVARRRRSRWGEVRDAMVEIVCCVTEVKIEVCRWEGSGRCLKLKKTSLLPLPLPQLEHRTTEAILIMIEGLIVCCTKTVG
jgi:hypothetical protein